MKKMIALLTAIMLLLSACSSATLDGAGKELEDTIANATDANNKYVQMVKGGYRTDNPDVTYEDAFTSFFGTPRWKYFESEDGQDVVEFTGDSTYQDVPVKARIQFVVDEENGTFEATYLAFNEVPQNALTLAALISKAFEGVEASNGNSESGNSNSSDFCYKGKSLSNLLGKSSEDVSAVFGNPTGGTPVTGELLYGGTEYWIYEDVGFYFDNGTVLWVGGNPEMVTLNGMALNMNPSELYNEFGEPSYERYIEDEAGEGDDYYYMEYILDGIVVGFEMPDGNSKSNYVTFSVYDNGDLNDNDIYFDDSGNYQNLDSSLVGRWRSYDGGTLEFTDSGVISSCDFNCWSLVGDTPDRIYWEASNGRVYCSAYFDDEDEYTIRAVTGPYSESEVEYISFSSNSRHRYSRAEGENGDGIVGKWVSMENSIWAFQFNVDGTGTYNGKYPLTWYTYTTDVNQGLKIREMRAAAIRPKR